MASKPENREAVPSQSPVLLAARRATLGLLRPHTFVNPNGVPHHDASTCETPSGYVFGGGARDPAWRPPDGVLTLGCGMEPLRGFVLVGIGGYPARRPRIRPGNR